MNKPIEKAATPGYGSFRTLISFANEIRDDIGHVPLRIDRSQMSKLSGSAATDTISTLRFFGLIAGEKAEPTPLFERFVMAKDDEARKPVLEEMARSAYAFLLNAPGFNIERATAAQVHEIFRSQGVSGSTLVRAVTLFLAVAKEAGIKVSPSVKPPKVTTNGTRSKKERKADAPPPPGGSSGNDNGAQTPPPEGTHRFELPIPGKPSVQVLVPDSLDAADWEMLSQMFGLYVSRWKGYSANAKSKEQNE